MYIQGFTFSKNDLAKIVADINMPCVVIYLMDNYALKLNCEINHVHTYLCGYIVGVELKYLDTDMIFS